MPTLGLIRAAEADTLEGATQRQIHLTTSWPPREPVPGPEGAIEKAKVGKESVKATKEASKAVDPAEAEHAATNFFRELAKKFGLNFALGEPGFFEEMGQAISKDPGSVGQLISQMGKGIDPLLQILAAPAVGAGSAAGDAYDIARGGVSAALGQGFDTHPDVVSNALRTIVPFFATSPAGASKLAGRALEGERPAISEGNLQNIVQSHNENGGATFSLNENRLLTPKRDTGFMVGVHPERGKVIDGPLTPDAVEAFVHENGDLFAQHPDLHVGTWKGPDGKTYLDLARRVDSKQEAFTLGTEFKQQEVFDLGKGESTPVDKLVKPGRELLKQDFKEQSFSDLRKYVKDNPGMSPAGAGDEEGRVRVGTAYLVARILAGAAVGGSQGQTPEERVRNAMIGAGLGAVMSPALVRKLAGMLKSGDVPPAEPPAAPRVTSVKIGNAQVPLDWNAIRTDEGLDKALQKVMHARKLEAEAMKRGVQPDEVRKGLAQALGLTPQDVMDIPIGEAVPAERLQAVVDVAMASEARLHELAKTVSMGETPENVDEFIKQLETTSNLGVRLYGLLGETGRALRVGAEHAQDLQRFGHVRDMLDAIQHGVMPPRQVAQALTQLPTAQGRMSMLRWGWKYGPKLLANGYIDALLTTTGAPIAKFLSEAGALVNGTWERFLRSGTDVLLRVPQEERVRPSEAWYDLTGAVGSWREALHAAVQHLKDGHTMPFGTNALEDPFSLASQQLQGPYSTAVKWLGTVMSMPSRLLGADTAFYKVMSARGRLHSLNQRRVQNMIDQGMIKEDQRGEALARLTRDPLDADVKASHNQADINTFSDPLVGLAQKLRGVTSHPVSRFILPFFRVPVNLGRYGFERMPAVGLLARRNREALASGDRAQLSETLAKQANGAMMTMFAWMLAANGRAGGKGSVKKDVRREEHADHPAYWVKVGNRFFGLERAEPFRFIFGASADLYDLLHEADTHDWQQGLDAVVLSISRNFTSSSYLQDVSRFIDAVTSEKPNAAESFGKMLSDIITSYAVPPLFQQMRRQADPAMRETYHFIDKLQNRVLGESEYLYPQIGLDGQQVHYDPLIAHFVPIPTKYDRKDPVRNEIIHNQMSFPLPSPVFYGFRPPSFGQEDQMSGIPLTPKQIYDLRRWAGNDLKLGGGALAAWGASHPRAFPTLPADPKEKYGMWDALHLLVDTPAYKEASDGPHGGKYELMSQVMNFYRSLAKKKLLKENPELLNEYRLKRLDRLVGRLHPRQESYLKQQLQLEEAK